MFDYERVGIFRVLSTRHPPGQRYLPLLIAHCWRRLGLAAMLNQCWTNLAAHATCKPICEVLWGLAYGWVETETGVLKAWGFPKSPSFVSVPKWSNDLILGYPYLRNLHISDPKSWTSFKKGLSISIDRFHCGQCVTVRRSRFVKKKLLRRLPSQFFHHSKPQVLQLRLRSLHMSSSLHGFQLPLPHFIPISDTIEYPIHWSHLPRTATIAP